MRDLWKTWATTLSLLTKAVLCLWEEISKNKFISRSELKLHGEYLFAGVFPAGGMNRKSIAIFG